MIDSPPEKLNKIKLIINFSVSDINNFKIDKTKAKLGMFPIYGIHSFWNLIFLSNSKK